MDPVTIATSLGAVATAGLGYLAARESGREYKRQTALSPAQFAEHLKEDKS